jgi:hypothetical protein
MFERDPVMEKQGGNGVEKRTWHIYIGQIPYSDKGNVWVSFESKPNLEKTRANIYGKCLPCIHHLYEQLKQGVSEIDLGHAYDCWKVTAVVSGMDECLSLLRLYEEKFPGGHVYGKFGSGQPFSETKVVVFHTEDEKTRDQVQKRLQACVKQVNKRGRVQVSRGCAVLHAGILGDWREWKPVTKLKHPEHVEALLERVRKTLFWAVM